MFQCSMLLSQCCVASECVSVNMGERAVAAYAALLALFVITTRAQDPNVYVEVSRRNHTEADRRTMELVRDLHSAKAEALLLYTEYAGKAGSDLKGFLKNISEYADEALRAVEKRPANDDTSYCRKRFDMKLKKIELDAYRAASFSGENHHKFLLGHMIVFRMHLNKTEEYIRKCERALYGCGVSCENKPKIKRWKRLAAEEIHRVQDDLQHSRRSYKDLVAHAKRRLNTLRKQINVRTADSVEDYHHCLDGNFDNDKFTRIN